jgi:hypothetical protein
MFNRKIANEVKIKTQKYRVSVHLSTIKMYAKEAAIVSLSGSRKFS